ncbi:DUF1465 family protein [Qipengyuania sp. JC766]|uniref:DUF1465 family protein n=1 Tax=Qipengyuania sp. JC766 TaxID=3232139 RepID=UPI003457F5DE
MGQPTDLTQPIIEGLYTEALLLADEVRETFALSDPPAAGSQAESMKLAFSVEGLRTTTRIMHVLAWLLNRRAYFNGELTEFQLRRHGQLPPDREPERENLELLGPDIETLIERTRRIHHRLSRLDTAWRAEFEMEPSALDRLRARLEVNFAGRA